MDEQAARELDELERRVLSPGVTFAWDRGSGGAVNMHWLRPGTILDAIPAGSWRPRSSPRAEVRSGRVLIRQTPF